MAVEAGVIMSSSPFCGGDGPLQDYEAELRLRATDRVSHKTDPVPIASLTGTESPPGPEELP
jgi:hypothetical protein